MYCTLAEAKFAVNKNDNDQDAWLGILIDAAKRQIDNYCGVTQLGGFLTDTEAAARVYAGSGNFYQQIDWCTEITLVEVKDAASDATFVAWTSPSLMYAGDGDWYAAAGGGRKPIFNRTPYTHIFCDPNGSYSVFTSGERDTLGAYFGDPKARGVPVPTVRVTARWGYADEVPEDVRTAAIMQVVRWYNRLQGAMASTVGNGEMGTINYYRKLDPDVEVFLLAGGYKMPGVW